MMPMCRVGLTAFSRTMRLRSAPLMIGAAMVVLGLGSAAAAQVGRLGAIGDSLTDEYAEETYSYAANWTMQLVQHRGVAMGPTAAAAGQPGGTWGEPRRTGYSSNWARYGADSVTAVSDGQHTGLAGQVGGSGGVTHAIVAIGANDFSPTTLTFFNIYWGLWSQSQINSYVNGRVANIRSIVETLDATNAGLVVCNCPDFGIVPAARDVYTNATRRNRVTAAVTQLNAGIEQIARDHHLMMVDLGGLATAIIGTNTSLNQFIQIGGVDIQLFNRDTASHTVPLAGFVDDGAHPHTALQGVFANVMMTALNQGWGAGLAPFSEQEILTNAGIAYGGVDTLPSEIGQYSEYVIDFACPGDFDRSGTVSSQDIFAFLAAFFAMDPRADVNGSGSISTQDIFDFLERFFMPCV